MKLPEFAVKNYQFTLVVFLGVLALGIYSLFTMPRSEDPEIHPPQFTVVVIYPGTQSQRYGAARGGPDGKEDQRARRYEARDHRHPRRAGRDAGGIQVQLDPDDKYQEVVREINSAPLATACRLPTSASTSRFRPT
jgi:hypothetical protein